jgi:Fe-coproporphyrin III synthase
MTPPGKCALSSVLGVTKIEKLYLQLLYRCNFRCSHCFHGADLMRREIIAPEAAVKVLAHFATVYGTQKVCLLGGEPLVYRGLLHVLSSAKELHYSTEVCTNGWRGISILEPIIPFLDILRVSLDGTETVHDQIRCRPGSFREAMRLLAWAKYRGTRTGSTCTLTRANVHAVPNLHRQLAMAGVDELVIHRLRRIGNALAFEVEDITADQARWLVHELPSGHHSSPCIRVDADVLALAGRISESADAPGDVLDRVEISPDGALYISCKVVGSKANAFCYDLTTDTIRYGARASDELTLCVPQVRYV